MRNIPFGRPIIGEEEKRAVLEVLSGDVLTHGPRVKEFEKKFAEYTGARHAIATASCTASLHLTYLALDLKPGDEVIVPSQTHTATGHAVEYCGGRPVFIDSEPKTGNLDVHRIESLLTDRTRAISVVHYLGVPVDMEHVNAIAARHGIPVVEDCALAIGTKIDGRHAGLFGCTGSFSFYPVKHITTGEGGMVITDDDVLAEKISRLRAFGIDRNIVSDRPRPGMYSVEALGFNYRLDEIGAALGVHQMDRIDGFLRKRKRNFELLRDALGDVAEVEMLQALDGRYESSYYAAAVLLKEESGKYDVVQYLKEKGVGTSVYYPAPVPLMPYYRRKYGYTEKDFPVASRISSASVTFPVGPHVVDEDIPYMVNALKEALVKTRS